MPDPSADAAPRFDPFSLLLGWLLPGLGHWWIGQRRRARRIGAGVFLLFLVGLLVGGVDVVDARDDRLWFVPQALCGPVTFGADYLNQKFVKTGTIGTRSIGRANELGTLFVALAGLMNLAAAIDAATRDPASRMDDRPHERRRRREDQAA